MDKINLKIYWVTTVWPKGQVIVPKECRKDFWVVVWWEFMIVMVDKSAFWIGKKYKVCKKIKKWFKIVEQNEIFHIGTKYQFVIPVLIRKELGIESWDNLIVIWKCNEGLGFIKNDKIEFLLDYIKEVIR